MLYRVKAEYLKDGSYTGDGDTQVFLEKNPDVVFDLNLKHVDEIGEIYIIFKTRKSTVEKVVDTLETHLYGWLRIDATEPWIDCLGVFDAL